MCRVFRNLITSIRVMRHIFFICKMLSLKKHSNWNKIPVLKSMHDYWSNYLNINVLKYQKTCSCTFLKIITLLCIAYHNVIEEKL